MRVSPGLTLLVGVGCLLVTGVSGAQSQSGQALAWDYPDHQVAELDIVHFEIRFDDRTPVPGVARARADQGDPSGLLGLFNIEPSDARRFNNFLRKHDCLGTSAGPGFASQTVSPQSGTRPERASGK